MKASATANKTATASPNHRLTTRTTTRTTANQLFKLQRNGRQQRTTWNTRQGVDFTCTPQHVQTYITRVTHALTSTNTCSKTTFKLQISSKTYTHTSPSPTTTSTAYSTYTHLLERKTDTNYYWRDTTRRSNNTLPPYPRMFIAKTTSRRNTSTSKGHATDRHYLRRCKKKWKKKGNPNHAIQP
jgi:hypothetical protein